MSNIIKAKALKGSSVFTPNQQSFDYPRSLKAIEYPMLFRNINPSPGINTTSFKINNQVINLYPGFYTFSDLIGILTDSFLSKSLSVIINVTGPNSYTISNTGDSVITVNCNKNFATLIGLEPGDTTIGIGLTVGPFSMNVTLGARMIEIKTAGLKTVVSVPIYSYYNDQVLLYFPNKLKFLENPKTEIVKEVTMMVDYVAIEASESLKAPDLTRIVFTLE